MRLPLTTKNTPAATAARATTACQRCKRARAGGAADFVSAPLPLSVIMIAATIFCGIFCGTRECCQCCASHRKNGHNRNTGGRGRRGRRRELRLFPLEPLPCQDASHFVSQPCCRRSTEEPETETKERTPWRRQRRPSPARGRCREQPASVPAFCSLPTSTPVGLARAGTATTT